MSLMTDMPSIIRMIPALLFLLALAPSVQQETGLEQAQESAIQATQDAELPKAQELPDSMQCNLMIVSVGQRQVGDPFSLVIDVSWDKSIVESRSLMMASDNEAFEQLDQSEKGEKRDRNRGEGFLTNTFIFELAAFETGELRLPDVEVAYKYLESGERRTAEIVLPAINIAEIPPDDEQSPDIREIRDVLDFPTAWQKIMLIGGIALGAMLLAGVLFALWLRRRRKVDAPAAAGPMRPIEEIAYEQLTALENSRLLREGRFKEYFSRLSWIVRNYLEQRYQFAAVEMTSVEIETVMGEYADAVVRGMIVTFNEHSDLAKFAKWRPSIGEGEEAMSLGRNIVARTTALAALEQVPEGAQEIAEDTPPPAFKKDVNETKGEGAP